MRDILLDFSSPEANEQMIETFAVGRTGGGTKWKEQLADELHKPVKRKFKRRRVIANGVDDIWSADLVDMQWSSRANKGFKHLLNVIDVFSKNAWSIPSKDKMGKSITDAFKKIVKRVEGGLKSYGLIKAQSFTTERFGAGWRRMMLKFTVSTTKVKLLWWRGLIAQ